MSLSKDHDHWYGIRDEIINLEIGEHWIRIYQMIDKYLVSKDL